MGLAGIVAREHLEIVTYETSSLAAFMLQAYPLWVTEEMTMGGDKNFGRETLEYALAELGRRAFAAGRTVEIVIYGGSAFCSP
jgi:hypothetical protein